MIQGWLDDVEAEVMACVRRSEPVSVPELARGLDVSEPCALAHVCLLASRGRLVIEQVSLPTLPLP